MPKRTGRGKRDIYHPGPALKVAQRWLNANILDQLPVHGGVFSYTRGRNISMHARVHTTGNYFLRLDFKDFFPSVNGQWIDEFLREAIENGSLDVDVDAVETIVRLLCRWDARRGLLALSIGAPSSPALSNAILFRLDSALQDACAQHECAYSRYADDIYVSSRRPEMRERVGPVVRRLIEDLVPQLQINEAKSMWLSRKRRVLVTGLVITSDRKVSVGRALKRQLRTEVYLWTRNALGAAQAAKLQGLIAYVDSVENSFTASLRTKFGAEVIDRLLHP
jgi:hypothetical protein